MPLASPPGVLPQPELPVTGGIGVPVGQWLHELAEPWSLHNEVNERWLRHGAVVWWSGMKLSNVLPGSTRR